jgi:hypothetical protein
MVDVGADTFKTAEAALNARSHPDTSVALVVSESACRMSSPPGPVSDLCVSVAHLRSLQGEITSQIASQISPGLA